MEPFDLVEAKRTWLSALEDADRFARERHPDELGCLYYAADREQFVVPRSGETLAAQGIVPHFGTPGGVLPRLADARIEGFEPGQY